MIESKKFSLNFEDEVKKAVNSLSRQEMQKYLYAKKYEIKNASDYEEILNKDIRDFFSSDLEEYLKKYLDNDDAKELCFVLEHSMYTSFNATLNNITDNDLITKISDFMNSCDISSLVRKFSLLDYTEAERIFKEVLNSFTFINGVKGIIKDNDKEDKTLLIFSLFRRLFNRKVNNESFSSDGIKNQLLGLFSTDDSKRIFNNDKNIFELINNMLTSFEKDNVLFVDKKIRIDAKLFNDERIRYYDRKFNLAKTVVTYNNQEAKEELIKNIIKLTYTSATQAVKYTFFNRQEVVVVDNSTIIPLGIYKRILNSIPEVINHAMSNYYMFLSGNEVVFYDGEGRKYSFPIKSIHILGLNDKAGGPGSSQENMLYNYFKNNPLSTHPFSSNLQRYKYDGYNYSNIYFFLDDSFKKELGEYVKNVIDIGRIDVVPLSKRIESLINAQGIVTSYMTTNDFDKKLDLLVYFYRKSKKIVTGVSNGIVQKITRKDYAVLDAILEENSYYFGNSFITYFKTKGRTEMFNKFCEKYNNFDEQTEICNRINTIMELQEFLTYQHRNIAYDILQLKDTNSQIDINIWKKYFEDSISSLSLSYDDQSSSLDISSGVLNKSFDKLNIIKNDDGSYTINGIYTTESNTEKEEFICTFKLDSDKKILEVTNNFNYDVEFNNSYRLKIHRKNRYNEYISITSDKDSLEVEYLNKGLGVFPLADLYINSQVTMNNNVFNGWGITSKFKSPVNILKILDKLLYLTHFNYSLDITNLFLDDIQKEDSIGIICEMMALESVLTATFEYKDEDDTMHFVSVQDTDSLLFVSSIISMIPNLIDFNRKQYKSLLAFVESGNSDFSNILTQSHSDFKKKSLKYERFVKGLVEDKITLRYATSGAMNDDKELLDGFLYNLESLNLIDLINRNLRGCSNALLWLEVVNSEEFEDFSNVKLPLLDGNGRFEYLKILLYKKIQNNILKITSLLNREVSYKLIVDMLQEYKISGNEEILDEILKDIPNILIKNAAALGELSSLDCTNPRLVCDFIEKCIEKYSSTIFIKDDQLNECKKLLERLKNNQNINNISVEIIDKILALNPDDLETFDFISNMNQDELNEFRKNIYLVYPSYIVSFLCKKFKLLNELPNNRNLKMINTDLMYIADNALLVAPEEYVDSLVGVKDDERSLLLYLENKIRVYSSYIRDMFIKGNLLLLNDEQSLNEDEPKIGDSLNEYLKLSYDLLRFTVQKRDLLARKNIEFDEKLNEKGMLSTIKNLVVAIDVRKDKIENEIHTLDCKIRDDKRKNELLSFINEFLHSIASNVSIDDVNNLFSLGNFIMELPDVIVYELIKKINILIDSDEIINNSELLNGLLALKTRIECDIEFKEKLSNISNNLKVSIDKLYRYKTRMLPNGQVEHRNIRNSDNSVASESVSIRDAIQLELDDKVKAVYYSLYRLINYRFENYPTYHKLYLKDLDEKVKKIFENQSVFTFKDSFELFTEPHILEYRNGMLAINLGARSKLKEFLEKEHSSEELAKQFSNYCKEEMSNINNLYSTCISKSVNSLDSNYYLKTGDDARRLKKYMDFFANSLDIIGEYSKILLSLFQEEFKTIVLNYVCVFDATPYIKDESLFVFNVDSLINKFLTTMNVFLKDVITEENGFVNTEERKEDYLNRFRDGIMKTISDEKLVSRQFDGENLNNVFGKKSTK